MAEREEGLATIGLKEAAKFLRLHPSTLAQRAKSKEIPGAKLGREWVFYEPDLLSYLRSLYEVLDGAAIALTEKLLRVVRAAKAPLGQ